MLAYVIFYIVLWLNLKIKIMTTLYQAIKGTDLTELINICLNEKISFQVLNWDQFYIYVYNDLLDQGYYNSIISKIEPEN